MADQNFRVKRGLEVGAGVTINAGIVTAVTLLDGNLNAPGKTYYVSTNGSDSYAGTTINRPFATLVKALSVATSGDTIFVQSGTFTEVFPLTVPVGVTVRGVGLRGTLIQPTTGTRQNDGFLLNGETTIEDLTIGNIYEPGYAFKFANNCKTTTRSPYVQRVTVLNKGSVISATDPYGFDTAHSPPTSYKAGRGVLIDGSVVDPTTLEPAMLFNECTFITPNNTALEMTNGARTEWVNCFTYLADKGIYAYDGPVGLGSTGYVRIKTSGLTTTSSTPAANDELYYLEANSQSGTYAQVGTALTITRVGHGLTVGDRIFADFTTGTATDGFYPVTGYVGVNTFSVTMAGSATTSGNVSYKEALGFGTVRSYTSATGLSSITAKGEGLFELPSSRTAKITTAYGNASLSTSQAKFGTASLSLDGVDDYAVIGNYSDFNFGTGDFTIEFWVRPSSIGTQQVILDSRISSGDTAIYLEINAAGNIRFFTANAYRLTSSVAVTANNWSHVALSRSSGVTRIFVNGTLTPTTYADTNDYSSRSFRIGGTFSGSVFYGGYVDELRISNIARYTSTFTTASGQFNSDGNDKILLHFDGINGSTSFTDSSIPTQDIRWVRSGVGIATATKITLADYQQFGAEMRSIGSAVVFGNTGISASGPGVGLRMFAFNFGHIGSGKDFSQDVSLVNQEAEVVKSNNANVYFVSIDQSGDFRVGDAFYVNQEAGTVNFGGQNFTLNSLSDLNISDGVNTNTITPTTATIGNIQISGNEITSTSGNININPSGTSETNIDGNLNVSGILTASVLQTSALQIGDTSIAIDDTGSNGTIRLNTDNVEALRVTNNQRIGIGTTAPTAKLDVLGDVKVTGVVTAITFNGNINSGVGTITNLNSITGNFTTANATTGNIVTGVVTTLSGTNAFYNTGTLQTGNIVTGVVTTISGTNAFYNTGTLQTGRIVTGIVTTLFGTTATYATGNIVTGVVTTLSGTNATYTTGNFGTANVTTGNIVTGVVTTISGTNAFYNTGTLQTGNIVTGVVTTLFGTTATYATGNIVTGVVTTLSGTNATYTTGNFGTANVTTGNIVTGVVTTLSGTNATYTTGNFGTANVTTGNIVTGVVTTLSGTNATYTTGNFGTANVTTGNIVTGVVTTLSGTDATYITGNLGTANVTTGNIVTGVVTTLSGTNATYTTGNFGTANITTGNIVTGVVTTLSGTNATYTTGNFGTANVTTGNIVTGVVTTLSGTNATYTTGNFGTANVTTGNIVTGVVTTLTSTNASLTNINSTGISTLGITSTTNLTAQQLVVSGVTTFQNNVNLGDNDKVIFGDGGDLEIYHDGASSYISDTGVGNLKLNTNGAGVLILKNDSEYIAEFLTDNAVKLYYDNSKKFETIGAGATIFGTLETQQLNVSGVSTFVGNVNLSGQLRGPAEFIIDPAAVGDNTGAVRIKGDLYVDGTTTQINSTSVEIADFIVGIASTATTDLLADGAGIKIGPDNTLLYDHSNTALKSSENFNLVSGKTYKINGTDVLSSTTLGSGVVNSSLTSVGTLGQLNVTGVTTSGTINATTGNITTLNSTTGNIVTGVVTTISGTNAFYNTGTLQTGRIVTGIVTTLFGTTATYATGNIVTGVVTTLSGTDATYTTGNFGTANITTGNIVTGVVTTLSGTNATYTTGNLGTANITTGNIVTGVVTTLSGTNATYTTGNLGTANVTTGNIVTGVVTTLSGTNATYTTGNLTTLNATTGNVVTGVVTTLFGTTATYATGNIVTGVVTTLSGTNATYTTGNFGTANVTTGNIVTGIVTTLFGSTATYQTGHITIGVVTTLSGTNATYATGNFTTINGVTGYISSGILTNVSGTNVTYTTGNFATGNIVTGVVTTLSGTNLNYSGVATFTNGPVLIGSGTSTGTATQRLQVSGGAYVSSSLGIGFTNPSAALHVSGQTFVSTGGKSGNNTYLSLQSTDASNKMELQFGNLTNSAWQIQSVENGVAFRPLLLNPNGGNVGIGTTNPGSTLDVRSTGAQIRAQHSTNNQSILLDSGGAGPRISFGANADNSFIEFGAYNNINNLDTKTRDLKIFSTSAPDAFILRQATGNIGIGTTNPTSKLHVVGNARITGILTIGTSSITLDGDNNIVRVGTSVTISGGIITATKFVGDGSALTGVGAALTIGTRTNGINNNDAVSNVTAIRFSGPPFTVTNLGGGEVLIQSESTFKTWYVNGQPTLVASGDDYVELIAGTGIAITTRDTASGIGTGQVKAVTITATGGGGGSIRVQDEGTTIGAAATTFNFVGSGVQATYSAGFTTVTISGGGGSALEVRDEGTTIGAAATAFNFVGSGVAATYSGGVATINISGGGGGGGSSQWVTTDAGIHTLSKVGIGTTNPTGLLDVRGTAYLDNLWINGQGTIYQNNGNWSFGWSSNGFLAQLTSNTDYTIASRDFIFYALGGGGGEKFRIKQNGNVGIGTTIPQTSLQLKGVLSFVKGSFSQIGYVADIAIGSTTTAAGFGTNPEFLNYFARSNIFIGDRVFENYTSGGFPAYNVVIGDGAGNTLGQGCVENVIIGRDAGSVNEGNGNNFIGNRSGESNTSGYYNNFIGYDAGNYNTTGGNNDFIGNESGYRNTTGNNNFYGGQYTGYYNQGGNYNLALGPWAANGFDGATTNQSYNIHLGSVNGGTIGGSYQVLIGSGNASGNRYFNLPNPNKSYQFAVGIRTDANPSKYWLVGNENFNIGIGTTNPTSKLTVGGDVLVSGISTFGDIQINTSTNNRKITTINNQPLTLEASSGTIFLDSRVTITGTTNASNLTAGILTATSLIKSGGTSSQFLKADGSVDSSTYLTSYTETDTLNSVTGRGNSTANGISVGVLTATRGNFTGIITSTGANISGVVTATSLVRSGGTSTQFLKADGSVDSSTYLTTTGSGIDLTGIVTSIVAGTNITISGSTGQVTINASGGGGGGSSQWVTTDAGIHTLSRIGIGTTNPIPLVNETSSILIGDTGLNPNGRGGRVVFAGAGTTFSGNSSYSNISLGFRSHLYIVDDPDLNGPWNSYRNIAIGDYANRIVVGDGNIGIGYYSNYGLYATDEGNAANYNTSIGHYAGQVSRKGSSNIHLGSLSGISDQGSYRIIIGSGFGGAFEGGYFGKKFDAPDAPAIDFADGQKGKDIQLAIGVRTSSAPSKYWIVGNENFNIGIGTTNPTSKLHVVGGANVVGTVTATAFVGDGSGLTNLPGGGGGSAITVQDEGSNIGTAATTFNFVGSGVAATYSGGVATVTVSGGGSGISTQWVTTNAGIHTLSNVGVGTTNPTSKLHVVSTANSNVETLVDYGVQVRSKSASYTSGLSYDIRQSVNYGTITFGNELGALTYSDHIDSRKAAISFFKDTSATTGIWLSPAGFNDFDTAGSNGLIVRSSGNIGVGTTNPTSKLHVVGDALIVGVVTATDFNSSSDINLKDNIRLIEDPISKVMSIRGVNFEWKENSQTSAGVVAQDIEQIMPELVKEIDGKKNVNYNGLIGLLVEVVKEQQKQIDELKRKLS